MGSTRCWPNGDEEGAAEEFVESAALGRQLAALLNPDVPVSGVTLGTLHPEGVEAGGAVLPVGEGCPRCVGDDGRLVYAGGG